MDFPNLFATASSFGSLYLLVWAHANPGTSAFTPSVWSTGPAYACALLLHGLIVRSLHPRATPPPPRDEEGAAERTSSMELLSRRPAAQGNVIAAPEGSADSVTFSDPGPPSITPELSSPAPSLPPLRCREAPSRRHTGTASTLLVATLQLHAAVTVTLAVLGLRNIDHPDHDTIIGLVFIGVSSLVGTRLWLREWAAGAIAKETLRRYEERYPLTVRLPAAVSPASANFFRGCQSNSYRCLPGTRVILRADCLQRLRPLATNLSTAADACALTDVTPPGLAYRNFAVGLFCLVCRLCHSWSNVGQDETSMKVDDEVIDPDRPTTPTSIDLLPPYQATADHLV